MIFFLFGGIREVSSIFFSYRDELRVIPDSDTMSLRIFGEIGSIRLKSRKNSLRVGETTNIWPFLKYNVLRGPEGAE